MKRNLLNFLLLVATVFGIQPAYAGALAPNGLTAFNKAGLSIVSGEKRHSFTVELAMTKKQQMQGLMFRRRMAANAGMLFVHRREKPVSMWMKNTYLPLDILFIDRGGKIVKIAERTVPFSERGISSGGAVIAVLELNAGTAARLGITPGNKVLAEALGTAP